MMAGDGAQGTRGIALAKPLLMLSARPALALAAQAMMAGILQRRGQSRPWRAAAGWWMVDGSLVDLGCLCALAALTRSEGIRPRDLLGQVTDGPGRELRQGLGSLVALAPAVVVSAALQRAFYGAEPPPQIAVVRLPRWATAYSVLIWPALWGTAEELTYLGYALPRLEARLGRLPAAALVAACWAAQHVVMPWLPDQRYLAARALTALPVSIETTALYLLRGRRLPPLIVGHWAADAATALFAARQP